MSGEIVYGPDFLDRLYGKQPPDAIEAAFWRLKHSTAPIMRVIWMAEYLYLHNVMPKPKLGPLQRGWERTW